MPHPQHLFTSLKTPSGGTKGRDSIAISRAGAARGEPGFGLGAAAVHHQRVPFAPGLARSGGASVSAGAPPDISFARVEGVGRELQWFTGFPVFGPEPAREMLAADTYAASPLGLLSRHIPNPLDHR